MANLYGIDLSRGAWAVARLPARAASGERPHASIVPLGDIATLWRRGDLAVVDIPIGLSNARTGSGDRDVDRACRKWCLTSSSVFPPPTRAELRIALRGVRPPGISVQTFGICRAIEAARRAGEPRVGAMLESHPEVVFGALGDRIVGATKRSLRGAIERANLLQAHFEFDVLAWVTAAEARHGGADDWLDALAMLLVARDWSAGARKMLQRPDGIPQPWKRGASAFVALPAGAPPEPPRRGVEHAFGTSPAIKPCRCGALEEAARDPNCAVRFDERRNEFEIVLARKQGTMCIWHCFFCGGSAPESKRKELFARVSHAEEQRLLELVAGLDTVEKAFAKLGRPDYDFPVGVISSDKVRDGEPRTRTGFRSFGYGNLSRTAEVRFDDYRPKGGALLASVVAKQSRDAT